jgi:hypothetical protein
MKAGIALLLLRASFLLTFGSAAMGGVIMAEARKDEDRGDRSGHSVQALAPEPVRRRHSRWTRAPQRGTCLARRTASARRREDVQDYACAYNAVAADGERREDEQTGLTIQPTSSVRSATACSQGAQICRARCDTRAALIHLAIARRLL